MRLVASISSLVFMVGCVTHPQDEHYAYPPSVVVAVDTLQANYDYWAAICTMKNVSTEPMWFDGEGMQNPAYSLEYRSSPMFEPMRSNGLFWGDVGLGRYELAPGQSITFLIRRSRFSEPFRIGVWLSPEADNKTFNDQVYWSETFSP